MANFSIAYKITAQYEGGYVNDPDDTGGETIFGVARNSWSGLQMWKTIDQYKADGITGKALEKACKENKDIMNEVETVYCTQYWKKVWGDRIENQDYANVIYDFAVNAGVSRAIRYCQMAVGTTQDGIIGWKTLNALNASTDFLNKYIDLRIQYYNDICKKRPANTKFLKGWTARANGFRK